MLSDNYFKIFSAQLKGAYFWGGTPFKWNAKERRIFVTTCSKFKYAANIAAMAAIGVFWLIQLMRYYRMGKSKEFYYYFLYALTICIIFDLISSFPFVRRPKFAAALITEFWRFCNEIQTDFMPTFDPNHSLVNMLFDALVFSAGIACPILGLLISSHHIFFPSWPCYFSSLVPPEELTWPIFLCSFLFYFYMLQMIWAVLLTMATSLLPYGWYSWQICNEFYCFGRDVRGPPGPKARRVWRWQKTTHEFRSFENWPMKYRQYQVLHLCFQEVFSCLILPIQAAITYLVVFCNFSLIKYRSTMSMANTLILLLWTTGGTITALVGLTFCGTMYGKSVRALGTAKKADWGSSHRNKFMKKFVRSCNPISFGYGRMYVIRMLSMFKFIKHLTHGTFRALLTLTKH